MLLVIVLVVMVLLKHCYHHLLMFVEVCSEMLFVVDCCLNLIRKGIYDKMNVKKVVTYDQNISLPTFVFYLRKVERDLTPPHHSAH